MNSLSLSELEKCLRRLLPSRDRWLIHDLYEALKTGREIDNPGQFKHHVNNTLQRLKRRRLARYKNGYWRGR